jgi:predicted transcriptional regulator
MLCRTIPWVLSPLRGVLAAQLSRGVPHQGDFQVVPASLRVTGRRRGGVALKRDRHFTKGRHRSQLPTRTDRNAELTACVVASFVSNHSVPISELPELINLTYRAFAGLDRADVERAVARVPAVPIEQSVADDYLVCLEDGHRLKTLKRYIGRHYDLTPQQYRARWGLPPDYPMVAPSYARLRSSLARRGPERSRADQGSAGNQENDSDAQS